MCLQAIYLGRLTAFRRHWACLQGCCALRSGAATSKMLLLTQRTQVRTSAVSWCQCVCLSWTGHLIRGCAGKLENLAGLVVRLGCEAGGAHAAEVKPFLRMMLAPLGSRACPVAPRRWD